MLQRTVWIFVTVLQENDTSGVFDFSRSWLNDL